MPRPTDPDTFHTSIFDRPVLLHELKWCFPCDLYLRLNRDVLQVRQINEILRSFVFLVEGPNSLPPGFRSIIAPDSRRAALSWNNVECLLANVFYVLLRGRRTLSVSLDQHIYAEVVGVTAGMINLINLITHSSRKLMLLKKGFSDRTQRTQSYMSRIIVTSEFLFWLDRHRPIISGLNCITKRTTKSKEVKTEEHHQLSYLKYMHSEEWYARRDLVNGRCGGRCEECRRQPMEHVHHLTYIRFGNECLSDLQGLCKECHWNKHKATKIGWSDVL